jgi:hypothetical protein
MAGSNYSFPGASAPIQLKCVPGVEPTNNRAERALREHVVQRKIMGSSETGREHSYTKQSQQFWQHENSRDRTQQKRYQKQ